MALSRLSPRSLSSKLPTTADTKLAISRYVNQGWKDFDPESPAHQLAWVTLRQSGLIRVSAEKVAKYVNGARQHASHGATNALEMWGVPKGHPPLEAYMGIPLYSRGEFLAMMGIANRPGGFDEQVKQTIEPLLATISSMVSARLACSSSQPDSSSQLSL